MPFLWTPENSPPQITPDAKDRVIDGIFSKGLTAFYVQQALPAFHAHYEQLTPEVRRLNFVNFDASEKKKSTPTKAFHAAIVVTAFAYLESGFDQPINEDAIIMADIEAGFTGVPETYLMSVAADPKLQEVLGYY